MAQYSFEPVYPIEDAVALVQAIRENPDDVVTHAKHACGIVGCVLEKHDSEESPQLLAAVDSTEVETLVEKDDYIGLSSLVERELDTPRNVAEGFGPLAWLAIRALAGVLLRRLLGDK